TVAVDVVNHRRERVLPGCLDDLEGVLSVVGQAHQERQLFLSALEQVAYIPLETRDHALHSGTEGELVAGEVSILCVEEGVGALVVDAALMARRGSVG